MQTLPDGEGAAEFSEVLKSFYKLVYEDQDEQLPAILKIFEKEKVPEKIKIIGKLKPKGHHGPRHKNEPNGYINSHEVNGTCKEFSVKMNGFPHRDSMDIKAGFPHRDSLAIRNKHGLQFSNAVNPVLIISSDELKEKEDEDDDDDDSGIQNGMSEGTLTFSLLQLPVTYIHVKQGNKFVTFLFCLVLLYNYQTSLYRHLQ